MKLHIDRKYITSGRAPFFSLAKKYSSGCDKILDIGPGNGLFAETLGKNDVYMIDGNAQSVNELRKKYPNCGLGTLPQIPFQDDFFDMVHASHVIEHLPPDRFYQTLKEIDRCLRPGGYLIISAPLLRSEFYDDLSHVKPYNPKILEKYLCWGTNLCCTQPLISHRYELLELLYRYSVVPFELSVVNQYSDLVTMCLTITRKIIYSLGFRTVEKSGFTIVLRKKI